MLTGLNSDDSGKERRFWEKKPAGIKKWLLRLNENLFGQLNFRLADKFVCGCDDELKYVTREKLFTPDNAVLCIARYR